MTDKLSWNEPRAYRRACYRESPKSSLRENLKFSVMAFAVLMGLRALSGLGKANPNLPSWGMTTLICLASAIFIGFVFPWLISLIAASIVHLSDKGINNNIVGHGATLYFWRWDQVAECELTQRIVGGQSFNVLNLIDADGMILASLGLAATPTPAEITAWLEAREMPVRNEL